MRATNRLFLLCALVVCAPLHAVTFDVQVQNSRYVPSELVIRPGDSVRWTNQTGAFHNVVADDNLFTSGSPQVNFTYTRTFTDVGSFRYFCSVHSTPGQDINTFENGVIRVSGGPRMFTINQGISGTWFEPATGGQGFMIDIEPTSPLMFVAWFTYMEAPPPPGAKVGSPGQRWLSAQGTYTGNTAAIPIFQTQGGVFDSPQPTTTAQVGSMVLTFTSCTQGTVTYNLPNENLSGEIAIQRLIMGSEDLCEMLADIPPASGAEDPTR